MSNSNIQPSSLFNFPFPQDPEDVSEGGFPFLPSCRLDDHRSVVKEELYEWTDLPKEVGVAPITVVTMTTECNVIVVMVTIPQGEQ